MITIFINKITRDGRFVKTRDEDVNAK